MRLVLVQLARLAFAIVLLYGAVWALSLLLVPREDAAKRIDTAHAAETLYLTEPKYVFWARERLATPTPKVVIVGASNSMAGLKQRELQPLLPGVEVHNLSVGGANITEISQVAALVHDAQTPAQRRDTTYVIGLWYGVFASDQARWYTPDRNAGDTDIDIERYRYGVYRRSPEGPVALLSPRYLDASAVVIHPYLVADQLARDLTASLRARLSGKPVKLTDEQRNARVISPVEQQQYLEFWRRYMGSVERLSDEPFETLKSLVEARVRDGSRVVLVDLPIPPWHARGSLLAQDYARRMDRLLPTLAALPGVSVLSLYGEAAEGDFSDEVHPKPRVSPRWAARLAEKLRAPSNTSASNLTSSNDHG